MQKQFLLAEQEPRSLVQKLELERGQVAPCEVEKSSCGDKGAVAEVVVIEAVAEVVEKGSGSQALAGSSPKRCHGSGTTTDTAVLISGSDDSLGVRGSGRNSVISSAVTEKGCGARNDDIYGGAGGVRRWECVSHHLSTLVNTNKLKSASFNSVTT